MWNTADQQHAQVCLDSAKCHCYLGLSDCLLRILPSAPSYLHRCSYIWSIKTAGGEPLIARRDSILVDTSSLSISLLSIAILTATLPILWHSLYFDQPDALLSPEHICSPGLGCFERLVAWQHLPSSQQALFPDAAHSRLETDFSRSKTCGWISRYAG